MSVTRTIRYEGNAAFASALVQDLKAEGVTVEWTPPSEARSDPVTAIVLTMVARGLYDAMLAGIKRFREKRLPGTRVEIQDDKDG